MKKRYWRALVRFRYSVGLATGGLMEAESFGDVSTGVMADLHAIMSALSRISASYLACERCMPEESRVTAMPRK
jgi:hypothetical protein